MRKVPIPIAHEDDRGTIADMLVEPFDSITRIVTNEGAIRGNHFHRDTHQWTYVVDGCLKVATRDVAAGGAVEHDLLRTGELMLSPPYEAHAWRALMPTTVLVFTRGPRSGENYEQDVVRLPDAERLIR